MTIPELETAAGWLGEALWRASWQGAIAIAVVWVLCAVLPQIPARTKSWLWRLAFLKVLLTFVWMRPAELELLRSVEERPSAPAIALAPSPEITDKPQTKPAAASETTSLSESLTARPIETSAATPSVSPSSALPESGSIPKPVFSWKMFAGALWLSGAGVFGGVLFLQYMRSVRLRRISKRFDDERVQHLLIPLARAMGLLRLPEVRTLPEATKPMLIGFFRPTLVFPEAIVANANNDALRLMIAHELAHIRRGDLGWMLLTAITRALFFFHPLVWKARSESMLSQEIACDELAVLISKKSAGEYARMLVDIVATQQPARSPALLALAVAESRKSLERRIKVMKFIGQRRTWFTRCAAAGAITLAVAALLPVRLVAAKAEAVNPSAQEVPAITQERAMTLVEHLERKSPKELRNILPTLVKDPLLEKHLDDLAKAEQRFAELSEDFSDEHPTIKAMVNTMAQINKQIDARTEGILEGLRIQAQVQQESAPDRPAETTDISDLLNVEIAKIQQQLAATQALVDGGRENPTTLFELRRSLHQAEYDRAALKNDLAGMRDALNQEAVAVLQLLEAKKKMVEAGRAENRELLKLQREAHTLKQRSAVLGQKVDQESQKREQELPRLATEGAAQERPERVPVVARTGGAVERVMAKVGDTVLKGQRLIIIDSSEAQDRFAKANAQFKVVRADLAIAMAEFNQVQKEHSERMKQIENGVVPRSSLPNLEKAKAAVAKAEAQEELALIEREQAQREQEKYLLVAPSDGVVTSIVHEGYWVPEGRGKILAEIGPPPNGWTRAQGVEQVEAKLAALQSRRAEMLKKYQAGHPTVREIDQEISDLSQWLQNEKALTQSGESRNK